jgi:hypothetical protein
MCRLREITLITKRTDIFRDTLFFLCPPLTPILQVNVRNKRGRREDCKGAKENHKQLQFIEIAISKK